MTRALRQAERAWTARGLGCLLVFGCSALSLASGCGSNNDGGLFGEPRAVSGAGGGGQSSAGAGGAAGAPNPTECDQSDCPGAQGDVGCCANDLKCGLLIGQSPEYECVTPDHGGTANNACPSAFVLGGSGQGCCRSNGTCGYLDNVYGTGCVDPAQIEMAPGQPCR